MNQLSTQRRYKNISIGSSVRFFTLTKLMLITFVAIWYYTSGEKESQRWKESENKIVYTASAELSNYLFEAIGDLLLLTQQKRLFAGNATTNERLAKEFVRFATVRRGYHQIRYIDLNGQEVVRVNYEAGTAVIVPPNELQNKAHRSYFQSAINLSAGEVFISRFDLNIENGEIEKPFRPVIRFSTPVYDITGNKLGLVVINYFGEKLLNKMSFLDKTSESHLMLLNASGYWLYSQVESDVWGFQLPGNRRITDTYPEWLDIGESANGQFVSDNGLFTYINVGEMLSYDRDWLERYTPAGAVSIIYAEKPWRIVSFVDPEKLYTTTLGQLKLAIMGLLLLVIPLTPLSIAWGKRRAQAAIDKNSIRIYASIVNQANELVYITDPFGVILYVNPAFERHTGYSADEAIGQTPRLLRSGHHASGFYTKLRETIFSGQVYKATFTNRKKDASLFYEEKTITPLVDTNGRVEYFVSTGRDLTLIYDTKKHEMEIATRLSESIPHHIINMLNGIIGFTRLALLMAEESQNKDIAYYLQEALVSSKEVEKLIEKIHVVGNKRLENLSVVSVIDIINNTVEKIRRKLSPGTKLHLNIDDNIPNIRGREDLIAEALTALINNAHDAIGERGVIEVTLRASMEVHENCVACGLPINGGYVEVGIIDNGEGIAPAIQEKIFDPFFTTKESGALVGVTPGLGLSAVRGITHALNGHILLNSQLNIGTQVRILLPMLS